SLQAGFQTRYEINKKVMPFVDFGYGYEKGLKQTAWQTGTDSEHGWYYGAGLTLKF
ncbi:copper resistance protein B, partial [Acinetobacter baumannii]